MLRSIVKKSLFISFEVIQVSSTWLFLSSALKSNNSIFKIIALVAPKVAVGAFCQVDPPSTDRSLATPSV
jgi:hypothetical protein